MFINLNMKDLNENIDLTLTGPKLHGIYCTESKLNYHGSITIDVNILEIAKLYPLEFVNIWNKNSGSRISTYILPGNRGSKICCMNGAAARTCQIGDELIVTAERKINIKKLLEMKIYKVNVLNFNKNNEIVELLNYSIDINNENIEFLLTNNENIINNY